MGPITDFACPSVRVVRTGSQLLTPKQKGVEKKNKITVNDSEGRRSGIRIWVRNAGELVHTARRTAAYYVGTGPTSSLVKWVRV